MPSQPLPTPSPVSESFTGVVMQIGAVQLLASAAMDEVGIVTQGDLIVRYGIHYAGATQMTIVPGLVVTDYGEMLTGDAAWHFLLKGSNLYPRAEVIGIRSDGKEDMTFVKQLDLARPVEVLVFADQDANVPIANPAALIAAHDVQLASRLSEYLPRYETLADWQTDNE